MLKKNSSCNFPHHTLLFVDQGRSGEMTILRCKVSVIGDPKVGKTSLCAASCGKPFPKNYMMVMYSLPPSLLLPLLYLDGTVFAFCFYRLWEWILRSRWSSSPNHHRSASSCICLTQVVMKSTPKFEQSIGIIPTC